MQIPHPLVIVGVCVPERRSYAARLAEAVDGRLLHVVDRLPARRHEPAEFSLAPPQAAVPVIVEVAADVDLPHLAIAAAGLSSIVCVVDALHLLHDLTDVAALRKDAPVGDDRGDVGARARRAVSLIENATMIALVNWETDATEELARSMAIASHLNPFARIRLTRGPADDVRALGVDTNPPVALLERAGWVHALNDEHDPHMTDPRVSTVRYEQHRPFHPARLSAALDTIHAGHVGTVLRSAGFCRLATRAGILARWDHVGSAIWIDPVSSDAEAATTSQDIAFTGLDLDPAALRSLLDAAVVTDAELTAGPDAWSLFADPLPAWPVNVDEAP